jgi:hypothetical protein
MAVPVVDHARRSAIQEITAKSPFNMFNIVAIVAIFVIGYFLYKKFTQKFQKGEINISDIVPTAAKVMKKAAPIVEAVPTKPEVIEEPGVKEE